MQTKDQFNYYRILYLLEDTHTGRLQIEMDLLPLCRPGDQNRYRTVRRVELSMSKELFDMEQIYAEISLPYYREVSLKWWEYLVLSNANLFPLHLAPQWTNILILLS